MASRKVKFEYYEVVYKKKEDDGSERDRLFDLVQWILKATRKSLEARTYDYRSEQARLDRAYFDDELGYYFLHFVRLRDTNIPSKAKIDSEVETFELEDDEYLGEQVSALYDENNHILMLQRNRYSLGPDGIEEYLNLIWDNENDTIYLRPICPPNVLDLVSDSKYYRKLNIRFADLNPDHFNGDGKSPLLGFIKNFGNYEGVTAEIIITMGRTKNTSLHRETVKDTLVEIAENKEIIEKAELVKKDNDDTAVEVIDLIEHKAHDFAYFPLERRSSLNHETVAYRMWQIYEENKRKLEILSYLHRE